MKRFAGLMVALMVLSCALVVADDDEAPKYKIKEVMKKCMGKNKLCAKVASGKASDDEKEQLVAMMTALSKNKPPKGELESWKKKTGALVEAAKAAAAGKEGAGAALGKAANCKACHNVHKGKK